MSLTRLQLAQFRSWARLDLALDRRPVAIFGPNGSGKTNILEAISMLSPGRGLRGAAPAEQARQAAASGWRVRAVLGGREVETGAAPAGPREVAIDGKPAPQVALGRLARVLWLVPAMDRLWTDAPEVRRRFLDRVTLSFLPEHAEASLTWDKAMRERNRLLRDEVADPGWYRALEEQMAEGWADDPDRDALAARLAEGRRRDLAAGRTLAGPHRADLGARWGPQDMPAALASTGEQKALLLSLILANARALAGETVLLLLDEVAAHLDAGRRAMLHDEIGALPAQAFLTGTGRELFESLDRRAMFLQVSQGGGTSRAEVEP